MSGGLSRRRFLRRTVGVAALFVGADLLPSVTNRAIAMTSGSPAVAARFYLYGLPTDGSAAQISSVGGEPSTLRPTAIATGLAARPVRSPDSGTLALVGLEQGQSDSAVTITYLDASSGAVAASGTVILPRVTDQDLILVEPTFAADSSTLCVVLAVSRVGVTQEFAKFDPVSGSIVTMRGGAWTTGHLLLFFDGTTGSFSGPYDLGDAPALARVNVVADKESLFVWSIQEPAALIRLKSADVGPPPVQLAAYPLHTQAARFTVVAPGPWPVNGEPTIVFATGGVGRLVNGSTLQVYSASDGSMATVALPGFDVTAKPMSTTMDQRPDGLVFLAAPSIGRAVLINPQAAFNVVATFAYPIPAYASGAPASKVALNPSGDTLYVVGQSSDGGIAAYDTSSGQRTTAFTTGRPFAALTLLPSGNLLGLALEAPRVTLLTPDLQLAAETDVDLQVAAII